MSQKEKYFYNIKDQEKGILRELGDGIKTRIFPGEQAMVSIVNVDPNAKGKVHSHPEEQWSYLIKGSATRIQNGEKQSPGWCF